MSRRHSENNGMGRRATAKSARFHVKPLTDETWWDFERLFGPRGACGGCWCMLWRLRRSEFERLKGAGTRSRMRVLVKSGATPGFLGYIHNRPVAWCAVAPRPEYPSLGRSHILQALDATPVWSISCLFIDKQFRRSGLSTAMLNAAKEFVRKRGGRVLEGYPVEPKKNVMPDVFAHTGIASAFRRTGFAEVARRSPARPIMRYQVRPASAG